MHFSSLKGLLRKVFLSGESYHGQNYCFTVLGKIMLFKVNLTTLHLFFLSRYNLSVLKDCKKYFKSRILLTVLEEL